MSTEEKGLALWGGVDLDLTLASLQHKTCEVCGAPATVAIRRLDEQRRRFFCALHQTAP
jgi:hypothetical protein